MTGLFDMISVALYVSFFQNLVFSGGYGISESMRMAAKPRRLLLYSLSISFYSVVTAAICRALDFIPRIKETGKVTHTVIFFFVIVVVYFSSAILLRLTLGAEPKFLSQMGISALNTLVLAVPFLNFGAGYSFFESIGMALGAGIAYFLATAIIGIGLQKLAENKDIPPVFQGTPAVFIYVALLSLAFSGFSGGALFA